MFPKGRPEIETLLKYGLLPKIVLHVHIKNSKS